MKSSGHEGSQGLVELRARLQAQLGDAVRILDVLGAHGSEYLLRARDVARDTDVLLRVFATDPAAASRTYWNFERRAEAAAELDHPNIVAAGPLQRGEGIAYYVVSDVAARTVDSLFGDADPPTLTRSLTILRDVAAALDHAHAQGIVHGQLEPSSIVLRESGGTVVSDFGAGGDAPASHRGRSAAYRAPEQWQQDALVDARADVYALGVMTFEMITGRRRAISHSSNGIAIIDPLEITHDVPLRAGVGLHVNQALLRAVSKRAMARFATAGEFVASLDGQSNGEPQGLPTERPAIEIPRSPHFALMPMVLVVALGITVGAIVVPSARRLLRRWGDVSTISFARDLHIPELPALSDAPLARRGKPSPSASDDEPLDGNNPSSSQSIFPGAATAAGSPTPGGRSPSVETPTSANASESPSPTRSVGEGESSTTASAAGELRASDSSATGFIRVEFDGPAAIVMVDEIPRGRTPFVGRAQPGAHTIRVVGSRSSFAIQQVRVFAGDTAVASFSK